MIGTDPKTDLALLKVDEKGDYPFVSFAKEAPRVGDWVVAIGNPFGLGGTVTAGIISAEGRDIGSGPYDQFLQIDAPINKGNSGGPTFNMKGEVVGVNTAIYSPSGGSVGVGFAIPASTADGVVNALEHGGVVSRGYLGVMIQPVSQEIADALGLKATDGALIDNAEPGTPGAEAGLKTGDVITKLNGQPVKDAADLTRQVGMLKPGDKVEISFFRDGAEKTVEPHARLAKERADRHGGATQKRKRAQARHPVGAGQRNHRRRRPGRRDCQRRSRRRCGEKGVAAGDVILDVSGKTVSQPSEVKAEIAAAKRRRQKGGNDEAQDRTGRSLRRVRIPEGVTARSARRER